MLLNKFSICQFRLTKWSFLVHSTMRNAPYIHLSHDLILELWRTFPNASQAVISLTLDGRWFVCSSYQMTDKFIDALL